jgi:hypothetical protein
VPAGHEDLKLRNWKEVAAAYRGMQEMFADISENGLPRPDDAARMESIRKAGERFHRAAVERPPGLAEGGEATVVTHPAYMANLVAALLERERLPLTDAQSRRLGELAAERGAQCDNSPTLEKDDGTFALERMLARFRVLEGFYAEVFSLLTPAQGQAVSPEERRQRMRLDMATATSVFSGSARLMIMKDENQVTETLTDILARDIQLTERRDELRAIVDAWAHADSYPAADVLDQKGFLRASIVSHAATRMLDLVQRIADGMKLEGEARDRARQLSGVFVFARN